MKPSYFKSVPIAALSRDVRLFFIGTWDYVDDAGRGIDDARLLKAELFPLDDDVTASTIETWLETLAEHGRIIRYFANGRRYFAVIHFREHQSISHAQPSSIPAPPSVESVSEDGSHNATLHPGSAMRTHSGNIPGVIPERSSGRGEERRGKERKGKERKQHSADAERELAWRSEFELAWQGYPRRANNPKTKAWKAYRARRQAGVSAETLRAAVLGYASHCRAERKDPRYVKQASTFFGADEHYLEFATPPEPEMIQVYDDRGEFTPEAAAYRGGSAA